MIVSLAGCAWIDRFNKTVQSDANGGLDRIVTIYSTDGTVIKDYEGKIDVEDTEYGNKVLFDLNGKRVIWYNATVSIEEQ
jgi:hypothetical protein